MKEKNEDGSFQETMDISNEIYRLYRFGKGESVLIQCPKILTIYEDHHVVIDKEGAIHEIPKGWIHIKYRLKEGNMPELLVEK